jgi:hypothetical protein
MSTVTPPTHTVLSNRKRLSLAFREYSNILRSEITTALALFKDQSELSGNDRQDHDGGDQVFRVPLKVDLDHVTSARITIGTCHYGLRRTDAIGESDQQINFEEDHPFLSIQKEFAQKNVYLVDETSEACYNNAKLFLYLGSVPEAVVNKELWHGYNRVVTQMA